MSPNFTEVARVRHELPTVTMGVIDRGSELPAGPARSTSAEPQTVLLDLRLAETWTDPDDVRDAIADETGLWAASGGGLLRVPFAEDQPTQWWTTADGLPDHRLTAIEQVPGGLALGTEGGSVLMVDVTTGSPVVVEYAKVGDARISDLMFADDSLYAATWGEGIWMSDGTDEALSFAAVGPKTGMQSRRVTSIAWSEGELVAGTAGAGLWVRGTNGKSRRFVQRGGLAGDFIVDLAERGDAVWIATPGGLSKYRRGVISTWAPGDDCPPGMPRALGTDGSLAISGGRIGRIGTVSSVGLPTSPDGLGPWNGVPRAEVRWLLRADGRRWVGTDRGIAVEDAAGTWTWIVHEGPGSNDITTAALHDGSLLVGTFDRGASIDGQPLRLGNAEVNDALIDADGVAWIATSRGVARVDERVRTFGAMHGLTSDHVGAIATDEEGRVWVGTSAGVQPFDGGSFGAPLGGEDAFKVGHVYDLVSTGGEIFAGTLEGLWSVRRGGATGFRYETGELPDSWINGVARGPTGRLWVGTYDAGLAMRETDGTWRWFIEGEDISSGWVNPGAMAALPDGSVLVGTMGGGLLRIDASGELERWNMADGLAGDDVTTIAVEGETIWVGTRSGLTRLEVSGDRSS
ncbi:MAG: hypothetical protein GY898_01775 [Proteobacteria bacterium]|nr:hypothetical protein [Pseudomonadota bacterium]